MKNQFDLGQWNTQKSFLKHGISNREAESAYHDPQSKIRVAFKHGVEEDGYLV